MIQSDLLRATYYELPVHCWSGSLSPLAGCLVFSLVGRLAALFACCPGAFGASPDPHPGLQFNYFNISFLYTRANIFH